MSSLYAGHSYLQLCGCAAHTTLTAVLEPLHQQLWHLLAVIAHCKPFHPLTCPCQDEDNLREALRYSAAMLGELRTSFLSPQRYYELYMQVFDELGNLEVGHRGSQRLWHLG